jgi:DNA repair protein RadC
MAILPAPHRFILAPIRTTQNAQQLFRFLEREEQEVVAVATLKATGEVISVDEVFRGSATESIAQPREILRLALMKNAVRILVGHNHVSGCPDPSEADMRFTLRLQSACRLIGIDLLDHLVIGSYGAYFSFRESSLLSTPSAAI